MKKSSHIVATAVSVFVVAVLLLSAQTALAESRAVDVNAASANELAGLKGIGPAKAQAIVDYRDANGSFESVEELRMVRGIGDKLLEQLRPQVTVGSDEKAPPKPKNQAAKR